MCETKSLWWKRAINLAKAATVACAFLAFAISMRQKEMDRFSTIKPLFEVTASIKDSLFTLENHGGLVYLVGIYDDSNGKVIAATPRQYSTLGEGNDATFKVFGPNKGGIIIYWRDVDLNVYELRIKETQDGYYIDGVPLAFRANRYITMSRQWLDTVCDWVFPKDWFSPLKEIAVPQLKNIDMLSDHVVIKYPPNT